MRWSVCYVAQRGLRVGYRSDYRVLAGRCVESAFLSVGDEGREWITDLMLADRTEPHHERFRAWV